MRVPRHSATDEAWPDQVNAPGTEHGDEEEDEEDEKGGSISWLLLLLTAGPLVVACVLLGMACFSGDIQSSNYLLKISGKGGKSPKLWLALSGFCLDTGSQTNCSISALNTYYSKAYKTSEVDVGDLKKYLPEDYGTNATLLLVSFVLVGVAAVFTGWAALDMRRAYLLEQEERRSWVAEWMQARVSTMFLSLSFVLTGKCAALGDVGRLLCSSCCRLRHGSRNRLSILYSCRERNGQRNGWRR